MKGNSKAQSRTSLDTTALRACFYLLLLLSVEQNNEKKLRENSNTLHIVEAGKYHHKQIIANHHSPHSQSHDLYNWFLSGRQIWMARKTLGRIKNVHILNIVRKVSSIVVLEASQALLQDVYKEFTWLKHMSNFFFFLNGRSYAHWYISIIPVKTSMVTTHWSMKSRISKICTSPVWAKWNVSQGCSQTWTLSSKDKLSCFSILESGGKERKGPN